MPSKLVENGLDSSYNEWFQGTYCFKGFPLKQIFQVIPATELQTSLNVTPQENIFFLWFGRLNPIFYFISDPKVSPEKTRKPKKKIRSICFFVSIFVYDFSGSDLYTFLYMFLFQMGFFYMILLGGGFYQTTPCEKYAQVVKLGSSQPKDRGENDQKKLRNPPPRRMIYPPVN